MRKLIGDRAFYRSVMAVALPIMIQNGITNFVSMLDNIMVGQIGTVQMSGVSIVNQIMLVFNIGLFGAISGAGIMGAQFYGNHDDEGLRYTFRFKLIFCFLFFLTCAGVLARFGSDLVALYLTGEAAAGDRELALMYAGQYLAIMMIGMLPFTVSQIYASTLRETSETFRPMVASVMAVGVNLCLNYLLIFGKFGFPELGVRGAAIATVISRFVECGYIVAWTHANALKNRFIIGAYKNFRVPIKLTGEILRKSLPLLANEFMFSLSLAILLQCYSVRGLIVVAAMNISNTITVVFQVVYMAFGDAVAIIVGQLLGAGLTEKARLTAYRLIAFSTVSCVVVGFAMALVSPFFPRIYATSDEVRALAQSLILISSIALPIHAFSNAAYFTIRSGGRTFITMLFDSVFMWVVSIPLAYVLSRYTGLDARLLYFSVCMADLIKCMIGFVLVKRGVWIRKIV